MHTGKLVFSQLMEFLPWRRFDTCVRRYGGDYKIKTFPCSEQLRVMAFAQLTYRESLRDIETCLRAVKAKRYHMGIRSGISRNNLSNANQTRDWRIYADFAQILIAEARSLYADEDLGIDLLMDVVRHRPDGRDLLGANRRSFAQCHPGDSSGERGNILITVPC